MIPVTVLPYEETKYKKGAVPEVTGMGLSDALYVLGNAGYKVVGAWQRNGGKAIGYRRKYYSKRIKNNNRTAMKYLSDILEGLAFTELQGSADMEISAIVFDSRKVVPGCMFVAVKGTQVDGHDYIEQAVNRWRRSRDLRRSARPCYRRGGFFYGGRFVHCLGHRCCQLL